MCPADRYPPDPACIVDIYKRVFDEPAPFLKGMVMLGFGATSPVLI
jgi:hypothetical protein